MSKMWFCVLDFLDEFFFSVLDTGHCTQRRHLDSSEGAGYDEDKVCKYV